MQTHFNESFKFGWGWVCLLFNPLNNPVLKHLALQILFWDTINNGIGFFSRGQPSTWWNVFIPGIGLQFWNIRMKPVFKCLSCYNIIWNIWKPLSKFIPNKPSCAPPFLIFSTYSFSSISSEVLFDQRQIQNQLRN